MHIHSFFLLLLMVISFQAFGQSEEEREFLVLENGEEANIPDSLQNKIEADSSITKEVLLQWYTARGFLNADMDTSTDSLVQVQTGCQFQVDELFVTYTGEMDSTFVLGNRGSYSQTMLESEIRILIFDLEEKGYLFAHSKITEFIPDSSACSISISLEINTGELVTSNEIYFSGTTTNSQQYLRKISRFRDSAIITPDYLNNLKSNLNTSELFSYVNDAQIFMRNDEPVIVMELEERALNQFDGLLGYVPNSDGEGQIIGSLELSLWSVLAEGNGINLLYERLKPEVSTLNMGISQNWIGNLPVGVSAGFQLRQNDTTYQAREFSLDGYYILGTGFRLTGGIGFQATTSGADVPRIIEPDGRKQVARLGFEYSTLDNFDVPTSGYNLMASLSVANKNLEDDSLAAFTQNALLFEARNFISIFRNSVIATRVQGFFLDAEHVTINDLFRFGGATSLRGFAEEQFQAGTMVWGDVEYRFLLNRYSYLFAFGAYGGYERPRLLTETDNTFQTIDYLYSTGFGLSYRTPIGRLTFSYAVSPEQSFANGKVHFGIRTSL